MIRAVLKKLAWIAGTVAILYAGVVVALPHVISKEKVAAMAKEKVKAATGRDLAFSDVSFVFWPNIGVELKDVTFSNPAWAKEKNMAALGKAEVALAVMPLLEKQIVVKRFVLNAPVINLEVGADGKTSWEFSKEAAPAAPAAPAAESGAASGGPAMAGYNLQLGQIRISGGKLSYVDGKKKSTTQINDVNVDIKLPKLDGALQLDGSLVYSGQRIDLSLALDRMGDFLAGKMTPGQMSLKGESFSAKADGSFATQGALMKGALDLDVPSLPKLLSWVQGTPEKKMPFEKVSFSSNAQVSGTDVVLKGASLALDDIQAKGDVNASFGGKPDIFARLSLGKLNLDRFTGEESKGAGGAAKKSGGGSQDWDTTPLDFSGLKALNADLKLETQGFSLRGAEVGPSTLTVTLQNGALNFKSSEASLFGGKFGSDLSLNANANAISFNFNTSGVQAKPLLETFAGFKKLSGTMEGRVAITSSGNSQKAIINNLGGDGNLVFRNGSLEGIDLVKIAKLIQSRLSNMGVGDGKTDFVEMGGTFTIAKGVLSNSDLKMKGPLVQATGKGTLDLPRKYINYRATPILTASSAVDDAKGIAVPVDITGPFANIKVVPDFASVVKDALQNPENMKATAQGVRDTVRDIRKNIKQDPASAIQNLLGGGGNTGGLGGLLGQPQQQAPAPATQPEAVPAQPSEPAPATP